MLDQLSDNACPKCGQRESLNICADIWAKFTNAGLDTEADGLPETGANFSQYSGCQCPQCGWTGVVEDTLTADED